MFTGMYVRLTLLPLLCLFCNLLTAQDLRESDFTRYSRQEGLSDDYITSLVQDATGYIWAATSSGLNRYNGSQFVQFHNTDDSLSLPAEEIKGLVFLGQSRLGVRTGVGLHMINTATGDARNIFIPYKQKKFQYKFNNIMSVRSCNNGDIIVLTRPGIYHYDQNYRLVYRYDHYKDSEITQPLIFGIGLLQLDEQRFIITSYLGFYLYNTLTHQVKKMEAADCPLLAEYLPLSQSKVFQIRTGRFFILPENSDSLIYVDVPTQQKIVSRLPVLPYQERLIGERSKLIQVNDTLFYFTGQVSGFHKMIFNPQTGNAHIFPEKYFAAYSCNSLLKDRDGYLWVGTNKGLFHQHNLQARIEQAPLPPNINTAFPNLIMDDVYGAGNQLYVACRENGGLLVFDKQPFRFNKRISFKSYAAAADNIYCLAPADEHSLLVGTERPLLRLNLQTHKVLQHWDLPEYEAADLQTDRQGHTWITAANIYTYSAATWQLTPVNTATPLYRGIQRALRLGLDSAGNIWMAGHGLCRYNPVTRQFDRLIDTFPYIKMPDRQVNNFVVDGHNTIWSNSNNNGLTGYNLLTGKWLHYTRSNGLQDNNIAAMTVVNNRLWMAGHSGLSCLDLATLRMVSFGKEDGFPDLPVADGSKFYYDTASRQLSIGFSRILVKFDPESLLTTMTAPPFFIENISIGDQQEIHFPAKEITTSWHRNDITVTLGSINFLNSSSQRFAYRILKADSSGWQQLGVRNTFNIASLAPGLYRVQVKLFAINNRWPEQLQELTIRVLPPFWLTPWFFGLLLLLAAIAVYTVFRWRTGILQRQLASEQSLRIKHEELNSINEQLAEAQLLALQTQMNPHFIFNALNGIKRMILEQDISNASRYLSKFAQMIRLTLSQSKQSFVTLKENIEYLESYLEMEKLRFDDSFTYTIQTDDELTDEGITIPTLMIQPLVENAIWHGLMHREGEKAVDIVFSLQGEVFTCAITDNGIGIRQAEKLKQQRKTAHRSVGLDNLRNRISIMNEKYHMDCALTITDRSDNGHHNTGTQAVLRFKLTDL